MSVSPSDGLAQSASTARWWLWGSSAAISFWDNALSSASEQGTILGRTHVDDLPVNVDGISQLKQDRPDLVLIAASRHETAWLTRTIEQFDQLGLAWRLLPSLNDLLTGQASDLFRQFPVARLAPGSGQVSGPYWAVDPVALLDRSPRPLDEEAIARTITGKTVMITGSGGSIGSELARIVCRFRPAKLVLVERSENALFEIDREMAKRYPQQLRAAVLHDVTDAPRTLAMMREHSPQVIFHAAAHKHVPMMEGHPAQALENNFYGTRSMADAADRCGAQRFVMISTDKAVRPSSVMGATKRMAELYIQDLNRRSKTTYSMVRFGNVLGSACSVIPIWSQQLAQGGPITVTHPQMQRYFMTIPEAAGLVIQSAALTQNGGEVFLLDMGEPIRILDMAHRFVERQGLKPGRDIAIEVTGIRPGEKMYEELAYESEEMLPTLHPSIRIWQTTPVDPDRMRQIIARFDQLRGQADDVSRHHWQEADAALLLQAIHWAVPEMSPPPLISPLTSSASSSSNPTAGTIGDQPMKASA